jgi:hypothetical protein
LLALRGARCGDDVPLAVARERGVVDIVDVETDWPVVGLVTAELFIMQVAATPGQRCVAQPRNVVQRVMKK